MSRDGTKATSANEEQIEKLAADLAVANKELESLAYAVSHDLRAPLRAIEGFADVVLEDYQDKLDPEGQRFLNIIKSSSLKASRMVDGLLAYSRLGRHEITISEFDGNELVQSIITELQNGIGDRKVDFQVQPLPVIRGDFFLVRELWKHLLINAVKFTRNSPVAKIEINACTQDGDHLFSVHDNGVGFDMKYSERLFQLFQRLHGESEFEGTGTGLAMAQRVIVRHGGRIWAEGKPHEGATFFFTLPK